MTISTDPARLHELLERQRRAFAAHASTYRERIDALRALEAGLRARQEALVRAVSDDFNGRAREETLLLELLPLYGEIAHARRNLCRWMKPRRVAPTWFLLPATARVMYQPLGVVGVIGAWNYQLLLSLSPVIGALAAGNRVMLKPSEVTPRTADVIAEIVAERFGADHVAAVTGGPDVAATFSALPFDHLIFTGSTRVGRLVMQAAAEHLTPVTLELGGKSPAIVHEAYPLGTAVERLTAGKLLNAGQTCVAPDYVLVPRARIAEFRAAFERTTASLYPRLVENRDYTRIATEPHWHRLAALVDDARRRGAAIVEVNPAGESCTPANRVFAPTLVIDPPDDSAVMGEEIFGPVLPLVPYDTLDDAIAYVKARPRPLALYYFDDDRRRIRHVLEHTISGGVTINDVIYHLAQDNLPFGGVGPSGMGHYHGFDGFETFSKKKGVMIQRGWSPLSLVRPPYGPRVRWIIEKVLLR